MDCDEQSHNFKAHGLIIVILSRNDSLFCHRTEVPGVDFHIPQVGEIQSFQTSDCRRRWNPRRLQLNKVNFGKSLIVPSVQQLAKECKEKIPPRYERPPIEPIIVSDDNLDWTVPVIDLQKLASDVATASDSESELHNLHSACRDWGFFQVVNHGVSKEMLDHFRIEIAKFFQLPFEEKKRKQLWQQPDNHEGFGQLFVVSEEQKLDWSDMFYITTLPHNLRHTELFDKLPQKLRETLETYSEELKRLALRILSYMSKALGMDVHEMEDLFRDGVQSMRMNYYPPCPEPDKAIGFTPHSDADALTILYQLNDTEGLQIRKDGKWVPIKPLHNALVVNIGDIMEIVSNGVYRSVEHRAAVNPTSERLSVATFYSCKLNCTLGPATSLVGPCNPPVFHQVPVEKYFKEFFARRLNGKSYLDFMRVVDED